jgi:DNA sulfur modification protein DndB
MSEWERVRKGLVTAGEIRTDYIHSHGVVLQAIARTGNCLLRKFPKQWTRKLAPIGDMDWRRANAKLWEGRALIGGRVSKNEQNVALTANAIKLHLKLPLTPEEARLEDALQRGNNGQKRR